MAFSSSLPRAIAENATFAKAFLGLAQLRDEKAATAEAFIGLMYLGGGSPLEARTLLTSAAAANEDVFTWWIEVAFAVGLYGRKPTLAGAFAGSKAQHFSEKAKDCLRSGKESWERLSTVKGVSAFNITAVASAIPECSVYIFAVVGKPTPALCVLPMEVHAKEELRKYLHATIGSPKGVKATERSASIEALQDMDENQVKALRLDGDIFAEPFKELLPGVTWATPEQKQRKMYLALEAWITAAALVPLEKAEVQISGPKKKPAGPGVAPSAAAASTGGATVVSSDDY